MWHPFLSPVGTEEQNPTRSINIPSLMNNTFANFRFCDFVSGLRLCVLALKIFPSYLLIFSSLCPCGFVLKSTLRPKRLDQ